MQETKDSPAKALTPAWRRARAALLGAALCAGFAAQAASLSYTATEMDPLASLWRYDYTLTGPLDAFGGVTVEFNYGFYANLASATADPQVTLAADIEPDALFGPGLVSASVPSGLAPGSSALFSVQFTWLGIGAPGAQSYTVFDNSGLTSGTTTVTGAPAAVPEPASLALALGGLLALGAVRRAKAA